MKILSRILKCIGQLMIILLISWFAELLRSWIPLPIPASIYGMLLLLLGLVTKIIPLSSVEMIGGVFWRIMPIVFIPAGVGLLNSWNVLQPFLIPVTVILIISAILVFGGTGCVAQWIIRLERKKAKQ